MRNVLRPILALISIAFFTSSVVAAEECVPVDEMGRPCISVIGVQRLNSASKYIGLYVSNSCNRPITAQAITSNGNAGADGIPAGRARYRLSVCDPANCGTYTGIRIFSENCRRDAPAGNKSKRNELPDPSENEARENNSAINVPKNSPKALKEHFRKPRSTVMSPHESVMNECDTIGAGDCWAKFDNEIGNSQGATKKNKDRYVDACLKEVMATEKYCDAAKKGSGYDKLFSIYKDINKHAGVQAGVLKKAIQADQQEQVRESAIPKADEEQKDNYEDVTTDKSNKASFDFCIPSERSASNNGCEFTCGFEGGELSGCLQTTAEVKAQCKSAFEGTSADRNNLRACDGR